MIQVQVYPKAKMSVIYDLFFAQIDLGNLVSKCKYNLTL